MTFCCSTFTCRFDGTVLQWIQSLLTNRTQLVNFAGEQTAPSILKCGVPQRSVSGQIMSKFYASDSIHISKSYGIYDHCYANNNQLYIHCRVNESAVAVLRLLDSIKAINDWLCLNRLKMKPDKTYIIWLWTRQQLAFINITSLTLHDDNCHNSSILTCFLTLRCQ